MVRPRQPEHGLAPRPAPLTPTDDQFDRHLGPHRRNTSAPSGVSELTAGQCSNTSMANSLTIFSVDAYPVFCIIKRRRRSRLTRNWYFFTPITVLNFSVYLPGTCFARREDLFTMLQIPLAILTFLPYGRPASVTG